MKRLFLDANVLFTAAHNPSGKASLLISLGTDCLLQLATSAYAKEEAHRNLMRKFPHCLDRFDAIFSSVHLAGDDETIVCPIELPYKDWPIYRGAHACGADVLLTGDLRDFGPFMNNPECSGGLLIQTVADFLRSL